MGAVAGLEGALPVGTGGRVSFWPEEGCCEISMFLLGFGVFVGILYAHTVLYGRIPQVVYRTHTRIRAHTYAHTRTHIRAYAHTGTQGGIGGMLYICTPTKKYRQKNSKF